MTYVVIINIVGEPVNFKKETKKKKQIVTTSGSYEPIREVVGASGAINSRANTRNSLARYHVRYRGERVRAT